MSETQTQRNYVGKGWQSKDEIFINIKLKKADLINIDENQWGEISLTIAKRKTPDEKSKATHSVYENTFNGK